jgi:hypothetical protein
MRRNTMLSPEERKRLINRNSKDMDSQTRAANDFRVRRKLKDWFKTDLLDVFIIFNQLPDETLKKTLHGDDDAYALLLIAERIMSILGFYLFEGDLENSDAWEIMAKFPSAWPEIEFRPVSNKDIERAVILNYLITKIIDRHLGAENPVRKARYYNFMRSVPELKDRIKITEKEKVGIEKVLGVSKKVKDLWATEGKELTPNLLTTFFPFLDLDSKGDKKSNGQKGRGVANVK